MVSQTILESVGAENLIFDGHELRRYNDRYWEVVSLPAQRKLVSETMKKSNLGAEIKDSTIRSACAVLRTECHILDHVWNVDRSAISVANGELRWNGKTHVFSEHRRESFRTTLLPVHFQEKVFPWRFVRFLFEIFWFDADRAQKVRLVCEFLGYSLIASAQFQKFLLMIGDGANGKSLLISIFIALIGSENCSFVSPCDFGERFLRSELKDKLLNVAAEFGAGARVADQWLKQIVAGDRIQADIKSQPPIHFEPYCTNLFATNIMPTTRDCSHGFFRRAMVLVFNRVFSEEEQDSTLKMQLTAELSGILNLALNGLTRLYTNGKFTEPQSCKQALLDWQAVSDPVQAFVDVWCVTGDSKSIRSKRLYEAFCQKGAMPMSAKAFSQRLKALRYVKDIINASDGGKLMLGIDLQLEDEA
jgi:putative DNA primase/helicase